MNNVNAVKTITLVAGQTYTNGKGERRRIRWLETNSEARGVSWESYPDADYSGYCRRSSFLRWLSDGFNKANPEQPMSEADLNRYNRIKDMAKLIGALPTLGEEARRRAESTIENLRKQV